MRKNRKLPYVTYDPDYNVGYLTLENARVEQSVEQSTFKGVTLLTSDYDKDGNLIGLEFMLKGTAHGKTKKEKGTKARKN